MSDTPWFTEAFGRDYLTVYAHRNDRAAAPEAGFAVRALDLEPGSHLLDLGCGAGRHSRALSDRGLVVTGVDLSPELLAEARRLDPDRRIPLVRADMRRIPLFGSFDAATLFFTSFGYFEETGEDLRVLTEVRRVLRPGGRLLLDYANRRQVIETLVPESRESVEGLTIRSRRRITPDGLRVEKHVRIDREDGSSREYTESVRLYSSAELESIFAAAGLGVLARHGDLTGAPLAKASPRLVLIGERPC